MTPIPRPIPEALAERIAQRFRVLGDTNRIRLLDELRDGALSVGELVERTGISQQNASKHLGVLLQAGIVDRRKDGTRARYGIADAGVFDLCEQVCGGLRRQAIDLDQLLNPAGD